MSSTGHKEDRQLKEAASDSVLATIPDRIIGERNPRGIPSCGFIEYVDKYMKEIGITTIEPLIGAYQQLYGKYKFMEGNLQRNKASFEKKIPETEKDIQMIEYLKKCQGNDEEMKTTFSLADNLYAKASIDCSTDKVCIWLGANVMVEYTYDEAMTLLSRNLEGAIEKKKQLEEDITFLRDQIITTEVNLARVFNYDVLSRRKEHDEKLAIELEGK